MEKYELIITAKHVREYCEVEYFLEETILDKVYDELEEAELEGYEICRKHNGYKMTIKIIK